MIVNRVRAALAGLLLAGPVLLGAQRPSTPLRVTIAYPAPGTVIEATDSIFAFGSISDTAAALTLDGHIVKVDRGGGWLAWIAVPDDSVISLVAEARHGGQRATAVSKVTRAGWVRRVGAWVDARSMAPTGFVAVPRGEMLSFTVRAAPGAKVRLLLPAHDPIVFAMDSLPDQIPEAVRAFGRDDRALARRFTGDRYIATVPALGAFAGDPLAADRPPDTGYLVEVVLHGDTTRIPWPVALVGLMRAPTSVRLDGDLPHHGGSDPETVGRAMPGGTYTWFFPAGTRSRVDGRRDDLVRLRLDANALAWVPRTSVHLLSDPDDRRAAVMGALTMTPSAAMTRLRIPLSFPAPVSVAETATGLDITLYNTVANANWTRFGAGAKFVTQLTWRQENSDRVVISVTLDRPLWGWRTVVDGTDLLIDLRPPPPINPLRPLAGRIIAIDAGHPPGGACGPTGLCEPVANLAVAELVRDRLKAAGAHVVMTRTTADSVSLWARVAASDAANAELLVSIHYNALPEGINPFTSTGSSTFFNHPHSKRFADSMQAALVTAFRLRNLGVARGDLALTRASWYPAILTEAASLSIPEQERIARTPAGARRYADAVVHGITSFLRGIGAVPHH